MGLLAASVLIPIGASFLAAGVLLFGAMFAIPMLLYGGLTWFAALLIALAAELGNTPPAKAPLSTTTTNF